MIALQIPIQYANSNNLINFIKNWLGAIDFISVDDFSSYYLNISTATTKGLNMWGGILNQSRIVSLNDATSGVFGFDNGIPPVGSQYPQNFQQGNFTSNQPANTNISLSDEAYRQLLQLLYYKYNSNYSVGSLNKMIQLYCNGRGQAYVLQNGFTIEYHFLFSLEAWEQNLFYNTDLLPLPTCFSIKIFSE